MEMYYTIVCFLFGIVLGSFYNVVGYRLPRGESLIHPSSHCTNCNHKLGILDLFPIFSYLFLGGKCRYCGQRISFFYPAFELITGLLFAISYQIFGPTIDLAIALIFISVLLIVVISDYQTMIIPDELLLFAILLLLPCIWIRGGIEEILSALIHGIGSFLFMFVLKKFGDILFKKESMGGGDIKLMFIFGLVLGFEISILSVFVASFIGLPISLWILYKKKDHEIPFGPFLASASILLFLFQVDFQNIVNLFVKY